MILERSNFSACGIFGKLTQQDGTFVACTLEHADKLGDIYRPKLSGGSYECQRGIHKIPTDIGFYVFETFQVMDVPGHSGILFHTGNFNNDSDGCILLGQDADGRQLYGSKDAFNAFMASLQGIDSFNLTVR